MSLFRVFVDGQLFYHPRLSQLSITEAKVQEEAAREREAAGRAERERRERERLAAEREASQNKGNLRDVSGAGFPKILRRRTAELRAPSAAALFGREKTLRALPPKKPDPPAPK